MEQIIKELQKHSTAQFNRLGIEKSEIANNNFLETIEKSARRMTNENRTSERDLDQAKQAFTIFIDKMYGFRESRAGQKDLVRLNALNESKSSICPLWPIC